MNQYLETAIEAAKIAGALLRDNYETELVVDALHDHDIKLELDVRAQDLITECLLGAFPDHALYGEEGIAGNLDSDWQWVVDPIDGTVNYFYGIPHFCVSIALRHKKEIVIGVIYDPMADSLWAVEKGGKPTLNGKEIQTSSREQLKDTVMTIGFSKTKESMDAGLQRYKKLAYKVRKTRMMGSAALALAYISCGRLDAYIEETISLWDVAAGILLVEAAGGKIELTSIENSEDKFSIKATNGRVMIED
ncbi:MAG: inositol monophosphatase [Verrucomicrobiales bacterium]|nr:inositol monophosphatase [Verrucomicrobiales bacterium]